MELLDRYLQAVRKYLPWKRQDDLLAELKANMESQLEDKEAELGRPLTKGELEDWLRAMGSPILVASRYQLQQYLIGPTIYPIYLYVLRVALPWAIAIYVVVNIVLIAFSSPGAPSVADAVIRAPGVLMTVAAWITLVFAAVEFVAARYPEKCPPITGLSSSWSPSSLPPLEKQDDFGKPRSYAHAVAEVVFGFIFLVWMLLIPYHPFLLMGPGVVVLTVAPFQLAAVWWTFFWWCVALNAIQLAWRSINLVRGAWQYRSRIENLTIKAFGLIPLGILLTARDGMYVLLKDPAVNSAHYSATLDSLNKSIHLGFQVIGVIVVLTLLVDLGQICLRAYQQRISSPTSSARRAR